MFIVPLVYVISVVACMACMKSYYNDSPANPDHLDYVYCYIPIVNTFLAISYLLEK